MNRSHSRRQSLSRTAAVCLAALLLSGCYAVTRDFPDLGDPPAEAGAAAGSAALAPVRVPPPPRPPRSLDEAAARSLQADATARLQAIAEATGPQAAALAAALTQAGQSGAAIDRRTAHFEFSRLSRLETELSSLIRRLSALPEGDRTGIDLRQRAAELRTRLENELDTWRPALAALGPAAD